MDRPSIERQIVAVDAAYRAAREDLARLEQDDTSTREEREDRLTRIQELRAARETLRDHGRRQGLILSNIDTALQRLAAARVAAQRDLDRTDGGLTS